MENYASFIRTAKSYDNAVDITIPTVTWGAHELTLWGGDSGDNRVIVTFPLSVASQTKTASAHQPMDLQTQLNRAYVQLQKNWYRPQA